MREWRKRRKWLHGVILLGWCAACAGRDLAGGGQALPKVLKGIDARAVQELRRAWIMAHAGTAAVEQVVVLTRTMERGYEAAVQAHTNRHVSSAFPLPPNAVAVFHTHPDTVLPEPSTHDRRLADRIGLPVFTMSSQGLFVYDPETRETSKLMKRRDWLQLDSWRGLSASDPPTLLEAHGAP